MRDVLVDHLEKNMLINNSQHGFRKGRSCLTNLLTFLDKVTGSLDSGENVVFLPHDARSASAVLLSYVVRPSVCPSVTLTYAEQ